MSRPFFSLIIPCYNTGDKFKRILDSLSRQNISGKDLEIIVVDDNSTDVSYQRFLTDCEYHVVIVSTDTNIHCPGNSRRKGMQYITGEWLCFCDHDDYFEDNALFIVKSYIESLNHKSYVVSTIMRGYDEEKHCYGETFAHKQAWLHGKFYNVDSLIRPYKINFRKNLVTHEDIYFNSAVLSVLYSLRTTWDLLDVCTYRWVDDANSITRVERTDRGYLYENFNDYLIAAAEPFWDRALKTRQWVYGNQLMMTILHAYFYYEAASYNEGAMAYKDVLEYIRKFVQRFISEFEIRAEDIIDFVYADPNKYELVMADCCICMGKFIPKTSFRDFILRLTDSKC